MSQCKKFAPNIFNKTKCSNCFRQKEEHSAVALECNRASRTTARSGYLFLAPDWDFSVPLNRTKRWQRRWFVLYDDGELSYSVDEHPDTIPQGSVDMSQVLEVTSAEQLTGHPHSLALTGPDRVTFVKAASREDARCWLELLAVFPRRHKRNATFPGGRASPSLPHLGRSASPQPPRPMRHLVVGGGEGGGGSPRTNFTTPPLKEERDPSVLGTGASPLASLPPSLANSGSSSSVGSNSSPRCSLVGAILKEDASAAAAKDNFAGLGVDMVDYKDQGGGGRPLWVPEATAMMSIETVGGARDALLANPRTEYLLSSGSPPTRDKLRCEDKARARRDWRHERLRDIATALTDRSPESSLALPAEGLLHLKKGWLWHCDSCTVASPTTDPCDQWRRRWWVLCGPSLLGYRDQDEEAGGAPLVSIELATVTGYSELHTDTRFGFQVMWSGGPPLTLSAVTMGIRSNWLQALRKAAPGIIESPPPSTPITTASCSSLPSSLPSSTSSSRHSTASSIQLTAAAISATSNPPNTPPPQQQLRLLRNSDSSSCRLSTGSSSGGGTPTTPRSGMCMVFSSDEEYRTASEGGRRDSMTDVDWVEYGGGGGGMVKNLLNRPKDPCYTTPTSPRPSRPHKLPRSSSSRQSTLDSNVSSPDELDTAAKNNKNNNANLTSAPTQSKCETIGGSPRSYRHSVADMRTRKLHMQLNLDEEEMGQRRCRLTEMEKELELARGEVRVLEEEARRLRGLLGEATSKELKGRDAVYELEKIERDLTLKLEKMLREQKSLNRRLSESEEAIRESDERSATLTRELQAKQRIVASLQDELACANERCAASRLENDRLYKKLQEFNTTPPTPTPTITPPPPISLQSISHLTNIDLDSTLAALPHTDLAHHCLDLRTRFERAVAEIRALQQRLREAHAHCDALQLERVRFGQRVDAGRIEYESRLAMMRDRVEDLTGKLLVADRQARIKVKGGGSKTGRRSLSLKGRESFSINKDLEDKVTLLEAKLLSLEQPASDRGRTTRRSRYQQQSSCGRRSTDNGSPIDDRSLRKLRRKSLDGATGSEPMKLLMRLNALEEKMGGGDGSGGCSGSGRGASSESLNAPGSGEGDRSNVVVEESGTVALLQARTAYLQCVTTLSPSHDTPHIDHMRELGRILRIPDIDTILLNISNSASSCSTDPVHASAHSLVGQLERALKQQYKELYDRRVRLRERGELDGRAKMELLAEKIAFEDVIIARIVQVLPAPSHSPPKTFLTRETQETNHLMHHLQSKLTTLTCPNPSTTLTPTTSTYLHTSVQYLTQLFTRHLLANANITSSTDVVQMLNEQHHQNQQLSATLNLVDEAAMEELLQEQCKVHVMLDEYQRVTLGDLVDRLLEDTDQLVMDNSCSLVESACGQMWDKARRSVSQELIQSEVRHVLMKVAQHYEDLNSSDHSGGYSFTLSALHRCQIELWTDSVEEHLMARIEHFITQLNSTYQQTKVSTRNSPSNPQGNSTALLHQYADIIAHVALVDARITTLLQRRKVTVATDVHQQLQRQDVDQHSCLNALLGDVSVVEFKAALKVGRLCAGQAIKGEEGDDKAGEMTVCTKCKEQQNLTMWDIRNDSGGTGWIGGNFNSYDSLPDLTTSLSLAPFSDSPSSLSPTFTFLHNSTTSSSSPPPFSNSQPPTTTTYHHQIALLRHAFQQTLTSTSAIGTPPTGAGAAQGHPASQRHIHLVENSVERLRVVCEQVLVTMERMHRGALQRMRVTHKQEVEAVRRDKEQALAEETHATLAALDAMRKAHEAEVVKEVSRFKQELSRQQASELLELRERLSVKCLEAAALQQQLGSATRQLAHAHQHILHMEQQRAPSPSEPLQNINKIKEFANKRGDEYSQRL